MSGQLGVSIFFVISGFVLPYSISKINYTIAGFPNFMLKRLLRIEPPYWATIALLFIVGIVPWQSFDIRQLAVNIFHIAPLFKNYNWYSPIFWTLSIEFQYYILLGLFFSPLMRCKPAVSILIICGISVISVLAKLNIRDLVFTHWYDFAAGYIAFMCMTNKIRTQTAIIYLAAFCAIVVWGVSIITGTLPFITVVIILFFNKKPYKPFLFLGNVSYSLYLTHTVVIFFFLKFAKAYLSNQVVLFTLAILFCVCFAALFYTIIEKPVLRRSKKLQ
ncbi:Peptidoglycan/LPS O-acetylase OafA/YrhL, contains acyltransferase and SGNH-hydrolase domains [Mucilaginibacter gossypiicola]|uniref:Peptidoglycan/LPS O-acetylase OafA/YrhL, contains acyltransferase and SGNH-hydrolase domains n=2 Tax=Mucilaginibacter gossypiicola TaxID=551995 RepID=A0A1H8MVN1_9SPHI|nr:Peptidoglycan/LPS O-acetylase OafA/YrhL, contains acyltransferase and SGNH-hydrolase domains [Mucilaginibacter gossypiicola]